MVNFSNVAVIRPSSKVVQVPGSSSFTSRGGGGIKDLIKHFGTIQDDIENKQLLKAAGLPPDIVDKMDSATLSALGQQVGMGRLKEIEQKGEDVRRGSAEFNFIEELQKLQKGSPNRIELNQDKGILAALTEPGLGRKREGELELLRQGADVVAQPRRVADDSGLVADPTDPALGPEALSDDWAGSQNLYPSQPQNGDELAKFLQIPPEQPLVDVEEHKRLFALAEAQGWPEDPQVNGEIALDKQQPSLRYPLAGLPRDLGMGPGMPSGFEGGDIPESRIGELAPVAKVTPGIKAQRGMEAFFNAYQLITDEERGILNRSIFFGKVQTEAGKEDAATAVFKRRLADPKRWHHDIAINPANGKMGVSFTDKFGELPTHFAFDSVNKDGTKNWTLPAKVIEYYQNVPSPKTFDDIQAVQLEYANQLAGLTDLRIAFDKTRGSLSTSGRFKTFFRRIFDHAGGFKEHNFIGKSAAWLANKFAPDFIHEQEKEFRDTVDLFISAEREFLQWRKFITGVAGGEKEFAEIRKSFLDVGSQGEVEFDQALTNLLALKKKSYEVYDKMWIAAKKNKWTPKQFQAIWKNRMREVVRKRDPRFLGGTQLTITKKAPKITKKSLNKVGDKKLNQALNQVTKVPSGD